MPDERWGAKITNLGLCKAGPSADEIPVGGGCGLIDPEYGRTGRFTEKSDVYCFGAVLFEVLCGRPIPEHIAARVYKSWVDWAIQFGWACNLHQIIDSYLLENMDPDSFMKFRETAMKCVADRGVDRPSMRHVISELECALQLQVSAEQRRAEAS
ncbi:hypothetical protein ACP70R_048640 [Stipagrostis hirtigluma subsp. patula]